MISIVKGLNAMLLFYQDYGTIVGDVGYLFFFLVLWDKPKIYNWNYTLFGSPPWPLDRQPRAFNSTQRDTNIWPHEYLQGNEL